MTAFPLMEYVTAGFMTSLQFNKKLEEALNDVTPSERIKYLKILINDYSIELTYIIEVINK